VLCVAKYLNVRREVMKTWGRRIHAAIGAAELVVQ